MIRVNDNFQKLPAVYLFTQISRRLNAYREEKSVLPLIRMDIGDIPGPIPPSVASAMEKAVEDLKNPETFKGYGPEQGYLFLRETIARKDYQDRNIDIDPSEIFISDGAKCDLGNLGDILSRDCSVAVMDPSYPAYTDDNIIDGRAGVAQQNLYSNITYLTCNIHNNYIPDLPDKPVDVIYLCSPNNPTGTVMTHKSLEKWVNYAKKEGSIIIFDSAYEAYIRSQGLPLSIYEIPGSKEIAIEVRSFSKTGGFTGVRCGSTVIPKEIIGYFKDGQPVTLNSLWSRRQTTKFNGASYISQRGAEALYSDAGKRESRKMIDGFLENAQKLKKIFEESGWQVSGGSDSPYVWAGNPFGKSSIEIFEILLEQCGISTTPGSGFGNGGEGFIRLSGFNSKENTDAAIERIKKFLKQDKAEI